LSSLSSSKLVFEMSAIPIRLAVLRSRLSLFLWSAATLVMVNDAVFTVSRVKDDGLHPTIRKGDLVFVDRTGTRKLTSGTVVLMRNPEATRGATHLRIVRRLEGKPDSRFGKFKYVKDYKESQTARDSEDFGSIPEAIVLGRVFAVAFPPWRAGWVSPKSPVLDTATANK